MNFEPFILIETLLTEKTAIIPAEDWIFSKFESVIFKFEFFLSNNVFNRAPVPPLTFSTIIWSIDIPY